MVFSIADKCQPCFPTEDRRKNLMVRVELRSAWMGGGMERSYAMEFVALWNECCSLATLFCFVEIDCSSFRTSYLLKNRRMLLPGLSREQNGVVPSCVFRHFGEAEKTVEPVRQSPSVRGRFLHEGGCHPLCHQFCTNHTID